VYRILPEVRKYFRTEGAVQRVAVRVHVRVALRVLIRNVVRKTFTEVRKYESTFESTKVRTKVPSKVQTVLSKVLSYFISKVRKYFATFVLSKVLSYDSTFVHRYSTRTYVYSTRTEVQQWKYFRTFESMIFYFRKYVVGLHVHVQLRFVPSKVLSYNVVVSIQEDTFVLKVRCTFVVSYESTSDPYTYFRMISYESTFVRRYEIKYFRTYYQGIYSTFVFLSYESSCTFVLSYFRIKIWKVLPYVYTCTKVFC